MPILVNVNMDLLSCVTEKNSLAFYTMYYTIKIAC